jgi:hypothetical protein
MRTAIGLLLIIVCLIGGIFFRYYNGVLIPYPILWYVSFVVLGLLGVWLISSSFRTTKRKLGQAANMESEKLKSGAEKIELNFDKCEFKSASFSHEVDDPNMGPIKLFVPTSINSLDTKITENVIQSYLIYTETINDKTYKFVSQAFPVDETTLKFYLLNHNIILYVDRFNRDRYLFELNR